MSVIRARRSVSVLAVGVTVALVAAGCGGTSEAEDEL